MKQKLMWIPEAKDRGAIAKKAPLVPYPYEKLPQKVWTLYKEIDPDKPPKLPFKPVHHEGAFIEDYTHDYDIYVIDKEGEKFLDYSSRVMEGSVWILLEWEDV